MSKKQKKRVKIEAQKSLLHHMLIASKACAAAQRDYGVSIGEFLGEVSDKMHRLNLMVERSRAKDTM